MADRSNISYKAGEAAGQAQMKRDEMMGKASDAMQSCKESSHDKKEEAAGFIQQTGEHIKNMAHGAAESVKNAVGMGDTKQH